MFVVNRSLVIIKPKQPYIDWVFGLPGPSVMDRDEIQRDYTTLLIPEVDSQAAADAYIQGIYQQLFTIELDAWPADRTFWPEPRDYITFLTWFEVELHMLVLDTVENQVIQEPYDRSWM